MSGFNGAIATPVNLTAAAKQRDTLEVYSKTEIDEKIVTINLGNFASLSALEAALDTFGAGLSNDTVKNVRFAMTAGASPFIGTTYIGLFNRTYEDRYQVTFNQNAGLDIIHGSKNSNGWSWQSMARNTWITNTTSFYECTHPTGISDNFGTALDNLHSNISSYTNEQAVTTHLTSNGPLFGVSFIKANNNYYGGILFGYYGDVVLAFKYSNGTYSVRFL